MKRQYRKRSATTALNKIAVKERPVAANQNCYEALVKPMPGYLEDSPVIIAQLKLKPAITRLHYLECTQRLAH